jgi:hypothetical protein
VKWISSVSVSSVCCARTIIVAQHFPKLAGDCRNQALVVNSTNGLQERHGARFEATVCARHACVRVCVCTKSHGAKAHRSTEAKKKRNLKKTGENKYKSTNFVGCRRPRIQWKASTRHR